MQNSTHKKLRHRVLLMLLSLFLGFSVTAQDVLMTESFENGGAMPAGWAKTTISGSDALTFETSSSSPSGFVAYDGTYMVKFASYSYSTAVNRLYTTTPFSTVGYDNLSVEFAWLESVGYATDNDRVDVQWSTDGTTWNTGGSFIRPGAADAWTLKMDALPAGAENQPTLYLGFLFTSEFGNNCYMDDVTVTGTSTGPAPVTFIIGTGTATASYPFYTLYEDSRTHMIYDAAEILAAGGLPGDITSIGFNLSSFNTMAMSNFTIQMQNYTESTLTGFVETGWTTVYGPTTVSMTSAGWVTFDLASPFDWDGTSNVLVSVCFDNDDWSGNSPVFGTAATGKTWHYHTDGAAGCTMGGGSTQATRPNITMTIQPNAVLPTGIVQGFTTNAYGVPVGGATIVAINDNGTFTTTSGPNGAYMMDDIFIGTYTMYASKEGYNVTTVDGVAIFQAMTTYQNFSLTQPSMAITPNPYSVIVNPNEYLEGAFNIANNGNGPLEWTAEIEYTEPVTANHTGASPGIDFATLNYVNNHESLSMIPAGNGEPLNSRNTMLCPEGSKFSLPPVGSNNGYTSSTSAGYKCYQQFIGATGSFKTLTFWAIFTSTPPSTMNFNIEVLAAGATPGAVLASLTNVAITPLATGTPVIGYPTYMFQVEIPSQNIPDGWISVQCTSASPTFYWLNSMSGVGTALQQSGTTYTTLPEKLAMCLSGGAGGWLTLGQETGTVNAFTNFNLPVFFNADGTEAGEVYTANVTFTSNPNVGTIVVPVTMTVAGDPVSMPEDFTAVLTNPITGQVNLSWTFVPTNDFLNFVIKRDGVTIGTTTANTFTNILPGFGTYNYSVQAVFEAGASVPAEAEVEWPNPTMFVDPLYIYDEVWVNQTATQTVTISNTGEGTLAFSFPDWVETDGGARAPLAYCTASGGCDEYIGNVSFGTINNSSGCSQYADYTSMSTDLEIGETYPITVSNPVPWSSDIVGVYIDWNQNELFTDDGELFTTTSSGGGATFTGNIIVPEDALPGPTRMRIRLQYGGTLSACGSSSFGEVEDYTVNVGMPGFITSVVPASGTIPQGGSQTVTITWDATGFDPGVSYFEDLIVTSNDLANPSATIVNEMFVYVPAQFAGTVTDIQTGEPLTGVVVTANPTGTFQTYTLDDGVNENGFGYTSGTGSLGNVYSTSDEGVLTSVDAYFYAGAAMTVPVNVEIYDMASNLLGVSEPMLITTEGWYTFELPNIPFSGNFYAMIHWPTMSGSTRYLVIDLNGPNSTANLSYEYYEGAWYTIQSYGYNGVFLLRPTGFISGTTTMVAFEPGVGNKPTHAPSFAVSNLQSNSGRSGVGRTSREIMSFTTLTDDNGEYSLYVDPGVYDVSFEKVGYQTYVELDTTALAGVVTPLDAQLREESYPPSFVYAEVNETDTEVLVTWGDGMGPYEVIYDDGTAENYAAWAVPGNMNAVKFTPASYPAIVTGGRIYVGDGSFPNNNTGFIGTTFGAMVVDDDGTNGLPGTTIDSVEVTVTNYGWVTFTGLEAEITEGDFYLVMVQGTLSPNTAPVGVDQENPIVYRSYSRNVGAGQPWGLAPYQDFMMRAIIFGSPSPADGIFTENSSEVRTPLKQRGLISQSPAITAAGGAEGSGIYKVAIDMMDNSRAVTGYRVVRYSGFDPDNSPETGTVTNLANNVQGNEYVDMAWAGLPAGWYAYGVAARYPDNYVSDTVISNIVGHNIDAEVTINVSLTTGGSPEGAFVSMVGQDYPYEVYSATVPADGQVIFPEVWYGNYVITAEKVGFDDYVMSANITSDRTFNIILAERKYKPRNLYVDPLTLVATWDEPLAIAVMEDFEGATFPPAGWQAITQNTTGWYGTTNGSSSAFVIPPHTKYAVTNDDADNGNGCCDYLITPEMNWTDLPTYRLNFASYYDGAYTQSAYVEISTDAGATWTVINTLAPAPGAWQEIEIDLAAYSGASGLGSVWLAFHADDNGEWASGWAVDDVQIASGGVPLQGYGVFLDGTLVGNTPERTWTYTNLNYGQEYLAGVAGLYSSGYSELDTYLFRSVYLIPPDSLAGVNPSQTDYVHLTWVAPTVPVMAANQDALPVIAAQPAADVATESFAHSFPQRSIPLSSSRVVLFDNGPLVNSPGTGSGGADESILQSNLGMSTYGSGMQQSAGNSVADDFTVTGNWNISGFEFFGYQTGSSTSSTFTGIFYRIWDGNPTSGGTVIYGDLTTNKMVSTEWANIYRNNNGPGGATDRPVMRIVASAEGLTLPAGDYWVEWTATGSGSSGPWVPAVTIDGQTTTGNAIQNQSGTWVALTDVGPQGMPFIINGSGGGGGQTVANLLGYNIYRDDALLAYVEKPALDYFDLNLDPGTYTYHITAVYDLTPYGYAGQTGESMIEGPIEVDVIYGYELPFVETFTTGLFETNQWTTNGENWQIAGQAGNPAPSALFSYAPVQNDYTLSLTSYWLNGAIITDGKIYVDFDLKLDDINATGDEQLLVEVFNGSAWVPAATYTADGDMNWEMQHVDITNSAKGNVFRVRFTAKGVNTLDITSWNIDNVHIYSICEAPTNLLAELYPGHQDQILLTWEAPNTPPPGPSGWLFWDNGTNFTAIGLQGGGTFNVAVRFTPAQLAEYAGTSMTKIRLFPINAGGTIVLKVWTGANASQLVLSQPVATYTANEWNEFNLNTPVMITGTTEVWFGYEITHGADYVAGTDAGPAVAGYGDMISLDGSVWESMSQAYALNFNWNLQGWVQSVDGVNALQPISDNGVYGPVTANAKLTRGAIQTSSNVTVSMEVVKGSRDLVGYNVYRRGELIATTTETTYLDDDPSISIFMEEWCYHVTAVYDNCESGFSNEECAIVTNTEVLDISAVSVYPNPSNNVVNIQLTNDISQLVIYNYVGQVVHEIVIAKDKNIQLDVRNYDAGAYLIKFITRSGESFTKKIAVTK